MKSEFENFVIVFNNSLTFSLLMIENRICFKNKFLLKEMKQKMNSNIN